MGGEDEYRWEEIISQTMYRKGRGGVSHRTKHNDSVLSSVVFVDIHRQILLGQCILRIESPSGQGHSAVRRSFQGSPGSSSSYSARPKDCPTPPYLDNSRNPSPTISLRLISSVAHESRFGTGKRDHPLEIRRIEVGRRDMAQPPRYHGLLFPFPFFGVIVLSCDWECERCCCFIRHCSGLRIVRSSLSPRFRPS